MKSKSHQYQCLTVNEMGNFYKETRTNAFRIARHSLVDFGCKGNHFYNNNGIKLLFLHCLLTVTIFLCIGDTDS